MIETAAPLSGRPLDEQGIDSLLASITAQYRRELDDAGAALRARRPPPVLLRPSVSTPKRTAGHDVDPAAQPVGSTVEQSVETRPASGAPPRSQGRSRRPRSLVVDILVPILVVLVLLIVVLAVIG